MKFAGIALIITLLIALFLAGCGTGAENFHPNTAEPTAVAIPKLYEESSTQPLPEYVQPIDYSQYYHNLNILRAYGVDKERISKIIYSINPQYFEGIKGIDVINSKQELRQKNGVYYPDSQKIVLYIDWESDEWLKMNMLHELKHHYCYMTTSNAEYNHTGCFLNTPIDKEYGFIQ